MKMKHFTKCTYSRRQIILQNGIERVELLELGSINLNVDSTDGTILAANYGVAVIGIIDSMIEDLLNQDLDLPTIESYEQIISYVYSHFGFTGTDILHSM